MKKINYLILIIVTSFFQHDIYAQNEMSDSLLKKHYPNDYIIRLEAKNRELDSLLNMLNGEFYDESIEENLNEDVEIEDTESNRRPSSQQAQSIISYYIPENNFFYYNVENQIEAVANGYYDTYIDSPNAEVRLDPNNSLLYFIKPKHKKSCQINIYGVTESGVKIQLGIFNYDVKEIK